MSEVKLDSTQLFGEFNSENGNLLCGRGLFPIVPEVKASFSTVEVIESGSEASNE